MIIATVLHMVLVSAVSAQTLKTEIQEIQSLKKKRELEFSTIRQQGDELKRHLSQLDVDLQKEEAAFRKRLRSVLVPLLHWPTLLVERRNTSFVDNDHYHLVLERLKLRLINEPLRLIKSREDDLARRREEKKDLDQKLASLQSRQGLLNLQIEELRQLLRKRK